MTRRAGSAAVLVAGAIAAMLATAAPARAEGRPPVLERFTARFNPSTTSTFYIAVASDPDGGKLRYRWSLRADCGFLTDPRATGPSNSYQFGRAARAPEGCSSEEERRAVITVRISDADGCTITYTQSARNETEHERPRVTQGPCPPPPGSGEQDRPASSRGVSPGTIVGVLLILGGGWYLLRRRPAPRDRAPWEEAPLERALRVEEAEPAAAYEPEPVAAEAFELPPPIKIQTSAQPAPVPAAQEPEPEPEVDDEILVERAWGVRLPDAFPEALEPAGAEVPEPVVSAEPECEEGAVRSAGSDFVAHDTVLSGTVFATARGGARIEIGPSNVRDIVRLADRLDSDAPLEVEVEIPLRLVTVMSSRKQVCRDGRWVLDMQSQTHDGPERTERLRAIVSSAEELQRFADEIVAKRLRTLGDARRRLETALASMRRGPGQNS